MEITVKVKYHASSSRVENYGNGKYLIYLESTVEDKSSHNLVVQMLSRYVGAPISHFTFKKTSVNGDMVFEVR